MKSAFISIIGRPSSGKSTLVNAVCRNKVSIVSPIPQTTRNKIRGIYTDTARGQLIFIDTPGYNISERKFNHYLKQIVYYTLDESDMVLYMIDSTRTPGEEEKAIVQLLKATKKTITIALNKIDRNPDYAEQYCTSLEQNFPGAKVFKISALSRTGVDKLIAYLLENAPDGELYYPEEYYTDQLPEFRISEIIREKVINQTRDEVPHSVYVEILDMEMKNDGNTLWVRAMINVERESQKGIIIGKDGKVIKLIKNLALKEITPLFPYEIDLDLRVKVNYKWRRKEHLISRILK